jgi:ketosteroid isomerase-like protein
MKRIGSALTVLCLAAPAHLPAQADSVRATARAFLAAFGDVSRFAAFYDQSPDFVDVEQGRLKSWAEHESDIRGFFGSARNLSAEWVGDPRVAMLGDSAAVVSGVARYRFRLADGRAFDNRQAVTLALRRRAGRWLIVQQHGSPAAERGGR